MNPYEKYQHQMVNTMTQGESLVMLYDEVIKQIDLAKNAIQAENTEDMGKAIAKAEKIILYLRGILDFKYPISYSLARLYEFFNSQLVMANIKKDVQPLNDIKPLVQELRDTFDLGNKVDRINRSTQAVGDAVV